MVQIGDAVWECPLSVVDLAIRIQTMPRESEIKDIFLGLCVLNSLS